MNQIQTEIDACMTQVRMESDHRIQACFRFPSTFAAFNGHFPGHPILPGICMIQAILHMLKSCKNKPVHLREILLAKYYNGVQPGDSIDFDCQDTPDTPATATIKAKLTSHGKRIAELKLNVEYAETSADILTISRRNTVSEI
ncbi:MAG: hypothetical protein EOM20_01150 [Spartobacteria bacterium]|nr:hypothetical protein [Spartobacteria bacterium]